jgi:hypothetical protein
MKNQRLRPLLIRDGQFHFQISKKYLAVLLIISFIGLSFTFKPVSSPDSDVSPAVTSKQGKEIPLLSAKTLVKPRIVSRASTKNGAVTQQQKLQQRAAAVGPGLGNLTYNSSELFKSIWKYTTPQHYGSNTAIMHNGYLITTYTPDSGRPPGGIMIWDVSNPRSPVLVKDIFDERTASLREAHSIGHHGNYIALQEGCGLQIWDLSNVQNPVLVKKFCIPGYFHDDYGASWQLFWQAPYIYIANGASGLDVVDATDIRNPVFVKHVNIGMQAGAIFAIGNLLVTTAHNTGRGYAVMDISDPKNPRVLNTVTSGENIYAGFVNGNRMIGSARGNANNSTFSVFDFTDPFNIKLGGRIDIGNSGEQLYCSTQDQFIFQGCQNEIVKIDASSLANMRVVGRGNLGIRGDSDHGQVTPMGNLVFVGNDHGSGSGFIVHQTAPDTKGPSVNMISPLSGSTRRALTSRIGMTFTDNVDLNTVNNTTFIVRPKGGSALSGKYSHQFSIVNFTPDQPLLPNTTYEIEIPAGGLKDWSGNATPTRFISFFSTGSTIDFPPAAPENVVLREENSRVVLSWNSTGSVTQYNIKRSTSITGPFNTVGTSTTTTYTDNTVTNGVAYYYVVSAVNAFGEGPNSSATKAVPQLYLTDLTWVSATNGYGPAEKDRSNGELGNADGRTISLDGQKYSRGIGVHANSTIIYNLNQEYGRFISDIGVDDEVSNGSCVFQVYLDGVLAFNSGLVSASNPKQTVNLSVAGVKELRLVVTDGGDGNSFDHGSWAGAHLIRGIQPGTYRIVARHSGKAIDVDANGVRLNQWEILSGRNQQWDVSVAEAGYYRLTSTSSGKVIDVNGHSTANDAIINQWDWTNGNNQKWAVESVGQNYYRITGKESGKVLDVAAGLLTNGAFLTQYTYVGAANQQWAFQSASLLRVGASETESAVAVQLYPNPAKEKVYVAFSNDSKEKVAIRVVNLQGIEVYKNETSSSELLIQTASFKPGIYTISIHGNSINVSKKLVLFE